MRINLIRLTTLFVLICFITVFFNYKTPNEIKTPNILFIVTDDQSPFSLKAYGNNICQTPNINRIAEGGTTILNSYIQGSWMSAVCVPSRIQIMTGRSLWKTVGLNGQSKYKNLSPQEANNSVSTKDPEYYSIPAIFNRLGYLTFRTCKPTTSYEGADHLFTYNYERDCTFEDDEHGSKWHGDKSVEFLEMIESKNVNDPFLMYVGFSHPHDPRHGKSYLYDKYGASEEPPSVVNPKSPPLPINYLPNHPFKHGNDNGRDETLVQGVMDKRDEITIRNEIGRQYACIENLDIEIGRILNKLEEIGELDNTYVFFCGDNGVAVGSHGLMGKQNLYEHSWRVPLIVSGPGIRINSKATGNTYLMDVLPTMCEIAGVEIPPMCSGKSFLPVLKGESNEIRETVYGVFNMFRENYGGKGNGSRPGIRAVRKGDWKLIKYDVYEGSVNKTQLFNLRENPNELLIEHHDKKVIELTNNKPRENQVNLANDPRYSDKVMEMEKLLLEQQIKFDDPFLLFGQKDVLIELNKQN